MTSSLLPHFLCLCDPWPLVCDHIMFAGSGNTGNVIRHQPSLSHFSVSYCPVPCMYPPIHDCILYSIYFYLCKFIIFVTFLLCSFLFIHFHTMFMSCMCMCRHIYFHTMFRSVFPVIQSHTMFTYSHIMLHTMFMRCMCMCRHIYFHTMFFYVFPVHTIPHYVHIPIMLPCYIVCALYVISTLCSSLYSFFIHCVCVYNIICDMYFHAFHTMFHCVCVPLCVCS